MLSSLFLKCNRPTQLKEALQTLPHFTNLAQISYNEFEAKFQPQADPSPILTNAIKIQLEVGDVSIKTHQEAKYQHRRVVTPASTTVPKESNITLSSYGADANVLKNGEVLVYDKNEVQKILQNRASMYSQRLKRTKHLSFQNNFYEIEDEVMPEAKPVESVEKAAQTLSTWYQQHAKRVSNWWSNEFDLRKDAFSKKEYEYLVKTIEAIGDTHLSSKYDETYVENREGLENAVGEYIFGAEVKGSVFNPYRIYAGMIAPYPKNLRALAEDVCRERGVSLIQDDADRRLYLIGFDLHNQLMKVYYFANVKEFPSYILESAATSDIYKEIKARNPNAFFRKTGLASCSYYLHNGELEEVKYYCYPGGCYDEIGFQGAIMVASNRGIVHQIDIVHSSEQLAAQAYGEGTNSWHSKVNAKGKELFEKFEKAGSLVTTLEYAHPDKFKLYLDC